MSKPLLKSRPTAYLSAGLLLLPFAAQAAQPSTSTSPQWACQAAPGGGWACQAQPAPAGTPERPAQPESTRKPLATAVAAPAAPTPAPSAPAAAPAPKPQPAPAPAPQQAIAPQPQAPAPAPRQAAAAPKPAGTESAVSWDWVPGSAVCCKPNAACDGAYVEPTQTWQDADKKPKDMPVRANAAHTEWEGNVVKMQGGVVVTQGNLKLTADSAELDQSTNQVRLYGDVVVRQPGTKITGSNADMTTSNSFGDVIDAKVLDYKTGMRVTAKKLVRRKEDVVELDEAVYTRCPPDREDWQLDSKHIRLNRKTGRGEAGDTVLRVADIPVFYTPYLNFPIDDRRQNGFLWPSIGSSSGGLDVAIPYYFNLAPDYDATLTPRFITDRGTMVEAELRDLNRFSDWQVTGTRLANDQKTGTDRWFVGVQERGQITSRFSTAIDYSKVSDNNYFHDFSIASLNIKRQTYLNQEVDLRYGYSSWFAQLTAQQYQNLDDLLQEPYRKLPQLTIGRAASGANFQLDYSLLTEMTAFDLDDRNQALNDTRPTGDRVYIEPGISFPMRWAPGYVKPQLLLRHVSYNVEWPEEAGAQRGHTSTTVPQAIVDAGLYFDRDFSFRDDQLLQTLEPRLYYLYSPYQKQTDQPNFDTSPLTFDYHQLFQPRRFTGHDRLEDFNQMAVGMTSRFIQTESGRELANASLGQIFYFANRKVNTLTNLAPANLQEPDRQANSSVAGQLTLQPNDPLWATANVLWSPDQNQLEQANAYVHYEPNNRAMYNLGYRYNRADPEVSTLFNGIRQIDASAAVPLSRHWRAFLRLNYDLDLGSSLEDMVGLEYEDCCWRTRIVYQRAVFGEEVNTVGVTETKRDQAIMVEFQLKGLGGLGRKVSTLLEESIWGYKERE